MAVVAPTPRAMVAMAIRENPRDRCSMRKAKRRSKRKFSASGRLCSALCCSRMAWGRAKLQCGLPPRLGGRHAGTQILLSLQGKMLGDLSLEALVGAPSGGEVREANEKAAQESHGRFSALTSKKRAMIAAV